MNTNARSRNATTGNLARRPASGSSRGNSPNFNNAGLRRLIPRR